LLRQEDKQKEQQYFKRLEEDKKQDWEEEKIYINNIDKEISINLLK